MTLHLVPVPLIDAVFPLVAKWIDAGLGRHTDMTLDRAYQTCRAGGGFMLVSGSYTEPTNVIICQFTEHRGTRVLSVLAMGGNGGENWAQLFDEICRWAGTVGAKRAVFEGRPGWQKILPKAKVIKQTYLIEIEDQ